MLNSRTAISPRSLRRSPALYGRCSRRLGRSLLRLEAEVDNPSHNPLPFGLGYHPYFRVPLVLGGTDEQCLVQVEASRYWELKDNLPSGTRVPVDAAHDLTKPRKYSDLIER